MKRLFLIIIPIVMAVMLIFTQCNKDAICTMEFVGISVNLKYPDGQPVLLDSNKVFWVSKNSYLEQKSSTWNMLNAYGSYPIADDGMQRELENKKEIIRFTGYLNGKIVCERDVLVGADRCHIKYLGTEPLTQIIYDIADEVRKNKFCELVNSERVFWIIPSYNAFNKTIDETLPIEHRLQMAVEWLLTHDCIIDARINHIVFPGMENNHEIVFSFIENGETVNMIMYIFRNAPYNATVITKY